MINATQKKPVMVQKEEIGNFRFPNHEVLSSGDQIKIRQKELERATLLGNIERSKIKIIFEDDQTLKRVDTTVWATTETSIVLKKGVIIPIQRIHEVKLV